MGSKYHTHSNRSKTITNTPQREFSNAYHCGHRLGGNVIYIYVSVCVCMYVCMYVCMCVCMCVFETPPSLSQKPRSSPTNIPNCPIDVPKAYSSIYKRSTVEQFAIQNAPLDILKAPMEPFDIQTYLFDIQKHRWSHQISKHRGSISKKPPVEAFDIHNAPFRYPKAHGPAIRYRKSPAR